MQIHTSANELLNLAKPHLNLPNEVSEINANHNSIVLAIKIPLLGERLVTIKFNSFCNSVLHLDVDISGHLISKVLPILQGWINSQLPAQISMHELDLQVDLNSLLSDRISGVHVDSIDYVHEMFRIDLNLQI